MATDRADGTVALIDLRSHKVVGNLPARNGPQALALAFFPDGRTLATGGANGHVTLWNVTTRSLVRTLRFRDPVVSLAASPDGELLAVQTQARGRREARVEVREISSGEVLYRHRLPYGGRGVSFSPDGRELAALGCCEPASIVEVWAARSGAERFHNRGNASAIAYSPHGHLLGAGTTDGRLVLWNANGGKQLGPPLRLATAALENISFSPDGRLLAASSADQTTTLLDLRSRKRLGNSFPIRQEAVPASQFTPEGDLIVAYLADAAQWPTRLQTWKRFACRLAGRDFTSSEWRDLLPDRKYRPVCSKQ